MLVKLKSMSSLGQEHSCNLYEWMGSHLNKGAQAAREAFVRRVVVIHRKLNATHPEVDLSERALVDLEQHLHKGCSTGGFSR